MMWGYWNGGPTWGWGMMFGMVLFWAAIIVGAVLLFRALGARPVVGAGPAPQDSALEIVRKRYASGEISREEYETLRKELQ